MTRPPLPPGLHGFDDLATGDRIETGAVCVSAPLIDAFAALTGDRFAIHMSDAEAVARGFPARVAHGLLVLSLVEGLKSSAAARIDAFAALGWSWTFRQPVLAGDCISALFTVTRLRPVKAGRGLVELTAKVLNQRGEIVQEGTTRLIARRAP
jgi:acyl dehydratase